VASLKWYAIPMGNTKADRRLAQNEVVFRQFNEAVFHGFKTIEKLAKEEGVDPPQLDEKTPLHFFCECSDENCKQRIKVSPEDYKEAHKSRDAFIIARGHQVKEIESVIEDKGDYFIVRKLMTPPKTANKLQSTDVDNTKKN
jgi:hypothetical protein